MFQLYCPNSLASTGLRFSQIICTQNNPNCTYPINPAANNDNRVDNHQIAEHPCQNCVPEQRPSRRAGQHRSIIGRRPNRPHSGAEDDENEEMYDWFESQWRRRDREQPSRNSRRDGGSRAGNEDEEMYAWLENVWRQRDHQPRVTLQRHQIIRIQPGRSRRREGPCWRITVEEVQRYSQRYGRTPHLSTIIIEPPRGSRLFCCLHRLCG